MAITRFLELLEQADGWSRPGLSHEEWAEATGRPIIEAAVDAAGGKVAWGSVERRVRT